MESTLQVLTECTTSGAGPRKEQIIAPTWSGASVSLQQMREMCKGGRGGTSERYWVVKIVSKGQRVHGDLI